MPKKCESCRFYAGHYRSFEESSCVRLELPADITAARELCDREGDGIFVYYEPKTPTAGAFVQITRELKAHAATAGRS